jgi:membrane fusion protein, heavy metal efflux system
MMGRLPIAVAATAIGIAVASFVPQIPQALRNAAGLGYAAAPNGAVTHLEEPGGLGPPRPDERRPKGEADTGDEQLVKLSGDQIDAAGIELAPVQDGTLSHRIVVPGTIVPHADRIARVSVKLSATVTELRKKLGDSVAKGEVVAVLESRAVADAKSEYLAARLNAELQKNLYERDKVLWDRHVMAEQLVLKSRGAAEQAKMNVDIARQKLFAVGLTESEIAGLPDEPEPLLSRQEVLAPMSGRVVDRKVDLGAVVGRDNLETELFAIADLDRVWVELAISPTDLPIVAEGQTVSVAAHGLTKRAVGKIVFISPMLDRDTHSARVVAEIANPDGNWRPGSLVTAAVAIGERTAPLTVPTSAVQSIGKAQVVFVRKADGFEKRQVLVGQGDDRLFEILSGVRAGEMIAVSNTFAIKAEFMKSLAEE